MVQGPVSKRRFSRRVVRQAMLVGAAVLAIFILVIAGWQTYSSSRVSTIESDRQQQDAQAKSYAQVISDHFLKLSKSLSSYAATDSIRSLFQQQDAGLLSLEADSAVTQFPAALKLRVLFPGRYDLDDSSNPPLSYGSIDLLNRAESSTGAIAAEALLFGSEKQHVVLVSRVKNQSDQLIGIVHLSLDVETLDQALERVGSVNGYIEIRQSASGTPLVLARKGNANLNSGQAVSASIAGTRWTLSYWASETVSAGSSADGGVVAGLLPVMFVVLLLIGAALIVVILKKKGSVSAGIAEIKKPAVSYAGAIEAIMNGVHPGMEKLISNLPEQKDAASHIPGISQGMRGEDITMIMKKDSLKMSSGEMKEIADKIGTQKQDKIDKPQAQQTEAKMDDLPEVIFRKYDIRGIVGETLTPEIVTKIGQAIGSMAEAAGQKAIVVARDGRLSGPELVASLIDGLKMAGRDVIDIGVVPTPVLYFATHHLKTNSGVMLTGSHNGPEYNGLKVVLAGNTLSEDGIAELSQRIKSGQMVSGTGTVTTSEIIADYVRRITEDIPVALGRAFKLVVDCGNGVAGVVAPQLYRAMGHDVIEMYCDMDGNFPNHHPDPSLPENMQALIDRVKSEQADLGFAFDGDGDRLGVVDSAGNIIWPDRQMMLFARDVLSRNPGAPIIFDVKCSSHLGRTIEENGGKALMWKTGHSLIKRKMKQENAPLAGEMSGHIFFKERWYGFDDAMYAGARLLEILLNSKIKPAEFFAQIPDSIATPELKIDLPESQHGAFMSELAEKISFEGAKIITIDGFRVEFSDGWGLIRPSNTTPCLVVRFEADTTAALDRIKTAFRELVNSVNPGLKIPF